MTLPGPSATRWQLDVRPVPWDDGFLEVPHLVWLDADGLELAIVGLLDRADALAIAEALVGLVTTFDAEAAAAPTD